MSIKTPLTMERVRHHFAYGFWKYLILVVAAAAGWNLIYTTTAYRPPAEKRIDFYVSGNGADTQALDLLMQTVWQEVLPDMELVQAYSLLSGSEDAYSQMQLTTYIMAGEGDVYLLEKDRFESFATGGAMVPLEGYVDSGALNTQGLDLKKGYATDSETGERHLYGIPADLLIGFNDYGVYTDNMVLCVTSLSGNEANAVKFVDYLLTHMQSSGGQAAQ